MYNIEIFRNPNAEIDGEYGEWSNQDIEFKDTLNEELFKHADIIMFHYLSKKTIELNCLVGVITGQDYLYKSTKLFIKKQDNSYHVVGTKLHGQKIKSVYIDLKISSPLLLIRTYVPSNENEIIIKAMTTKEFENKYLIDLIVGE